MRLEILDNPQSLQDSVRAVFETNPAPRHSAFFLAVSMVVDLYRFRHDGPVQARRNEAFKLLLQQIDHITDTSKKRFTEEDDLARRALMFAHKSEIVAMLNAGTPPSVGQLGFDQEADLSTATLNSHLSYIRRQYLLDGLRKVAVYCSRSN